MIVIDKRSGLPHSTHPRSSVRDRATSYASPIICTSFFRGVSRSFWPFLIIMWMRGSFSFHMYSAFCAVGRAFVDFYLVSTPMSLRDIHTAKSLLETAKNSKESILEWWYYGRFWHSYINRHSQLFLISFFLFWSSVGLLLHESSVSLCLPCWKHKCLIYSRSAARKENRKLKTGNFF